MTVWIVQQGVYSTRHVVCVCDTQERALAVCKAINDGDDLYTDREATEWPLVNYAPEQITVYHRRISFHPNGKLMTDRSWVETLWRWQGDRGPVEIYGPTDYRKTSYPRWEVEVYGTDGNGVQSITPYEHAPKETEP